MGIPKFFRWLSERYPCISQVVTDDQIPVFDNLYLDMNGIIHNCSHGNSPDPNFVVTEETVFNDVFAYVDALFHIIKPRKLFYLAIDGVAPRAKMNQQRARRFRSAFEAAENRRKAEEKGVTLTGDHFDSNCITPGTPFMARLSAQLRYFIHLKITTDRRWRHVKVIFSGHEVPGEGEHKIMDYIRQHRAQPDWDPNTRHCLYGLDADLIVLGLLTHEPHFSLLREEVVFGKNKKASSDAAKITWNLLHLSLVREYTAIEFGLEVNQVDFERVIDDWVLICYLVGNDFIPHLPNLHIDQDALPFLFDHYKDHVLRPQGGPYYLHEGGTMNLANMERFMASMAEFDKIKFDEQYVDMAWLDSKMQQATLDDPEDIESKEAEGEDEETEEEFIVVKSKPKQKKLTRMTVTTEDEQEELMKQEFRDWKHSYYREKFGVENVTDEFVKKVVIEYLRALQWNLHYYYDGIVSWSWYYPYHYAPMASDIKDFKDDAAINSFALGTPFTPFQQLMGVLPPASVKFVPPAFHPLVLSPSSPILDFYPKTFKTDLNGKKHDWEAVTLLPFIDEARLLAAMAQYEGQLTKEERKRSELGTDLVFSYDPDHPFTYPSPWLEKYPNLIDCQCKCEPAIPPPTMPLQKGLLPGVVMDGLWGFPTLTNLPHTSELNSDVKVQIFNNPSRAKLVVIVTVADAHVKQYIDAQAAAKKFLGRTCYFGWPHLKEGLVTKVVDAKNVYTLGGNLENAIASGTLSKLPHTQRPPSPQETAEFEKEAKSAEEFQCKRKGIKTGRVRGLVYCRMVSGTKMVSRADGFAMAKQYKSEEIACPAQLIVEDKAPFKHIIRDVSQQFPLGSDVFYLDEDFYGALGQVVATFKSSLNLTLRMKVPVLQLHNLVAKYPDANYRPQHMVAREAGISTLALSKITSSCQIDLNDEGGYGNRADIGLNIKFQMKNLQKAGYARRNGMSWEYSDETAAILKEYKQRFPEVFAALDQQQRGDRLHYTLFGDRGACNKKVTEIKNWLKSLPVEQAPMVLCGTELLSKEGIAAVDKALAEYRDSPQTTTITKELKGVRSNQVFQPIEGMTSPDPNADFFLGDRVVSAMESGVVPYAAHGVIVGVHGETGDTVDVLFDMPFVGGTSLEGRCPPQRGFQLKTLFLINISYGQRNHSTYLSRNPTAVQTQFYLGAAPVRPAKPSNRPPRPVHIPNPNQQARPALSPSMAYVPGQRGPIRIAPRAAENPNPTPTGSWSRGPPPVSLLKNPPGQPNLRTPSQAAAAGEGASQTPNETPAPQPQWQEIAQEKQILKHLPKEKPAEGEGETQENPKQKPPRKPKDSAPAGGAAIPTAFVPSQALRGRGKKIAEEGQTQPANPPPAPTQAPHPPMQQQPPRGPYPPPPGTMPFYPMPPPQGGFIPALFTGPGPVVVPPQPQANQPRAPAEEVADLWQKLQSAAARGPAAPAAPGGGTGASETEKGGKQQHGGGHSGKKKEGKGSGKGKGHGPKLVAPSDLLGQVEDGEKKETSNEPAKEKEKGGENEGKSEKQDSKDDTEQQGKDKIEQFLATLQADNERKKQQLFQSSTAAATTTPSPAVAPNAAKPAPPTQAQPAPAPYAAPYGAPPMGPGPGYLQPTMGMPFAPPPPMNGGQPMPPYAAPYMPYPPYYPPFMPPPGPFPPPPHGVPWMQPRPVPQQQMTRGHQQGGQRGGGGRGRGGRGGNAASGGDLNWQQQQLIGGNSGPRGGGDGLGGRGRGGHGKPRKNRQNQEGGKQEKQQQAQPEQEKKE